MCLKRQFPPGAVGILHQFQLLPVCDDKLGGNAALQVQPPLAVQFQLHACGAKGKVRLGVGAILPGKLGILRKGQVKVPAVQFPVLTAVQQVKGGISPENHLFRQHFPVCHSGVCPVIHDLLRLGCGVGKGQVLLHGKRLFPRFLCHAHRVGVFQQFHSLRDRFRLEQRDLRRNEGFHKRAQAAPDQDFSGRHAAGIHQSGQ